MKKAAALISAALMLTLAGCSASPVDRAYAACEKYVNAGGASSSNVEEYCDPEQSGGSEEIFMNNVRQLITQWNSGNPDEQITIDF